MREKLLINSNQIPIFQMITIGFLPGFLKRTIYKFKGYSLGKGVSLGLGSIIIGESVTIEEGAKIGFGTVLIGKKIRIGRYVQIGSLTYINVNKIDINDDARINNQVYIGGMDFPESELIIGKRTIIMEYSFLNPTCPLHIGDDTGIGGKCSIFTHGSWQSQLDGYPVSFAPVTLGKNVWIPWDVFIIPGVTIGDNVTIGAASLITKDIPEGALAAGFPAKVLKTKDVRLRPIDPDTRKEHLQKYLRGFCDYLEFYKIKLLEHKLHDDHEIFSFLIKNKKSFIIYSKIKPSWRNIANNKIYNSKSTVCLSYTQIDSKDRLYFKKHSLMWIDIEKKERSPQSSSIGEQLLKYLSRYGVRFSEIQNIR